MGVYDKILMIITKCFCNPLREHCIFVKISIKFNFLPDDSMMASQLK